MPANRANIAWYLDNMIAAPAAEATVHTIFRTEDGIMFCYGTAMHQTLNGHAAGTYASGCLYIRMWGEADKLYINENDAGEMASFHAVQTD